MRVFLTGGNGLLGHAVIIALLHQGHEVYALVRDKNKVLITDSRLHVIEGSLLNEKDLNRSMDHCEAVIHAASLTDFNLPYSAYLDINVKGSELLLKIAEQKNIQNLLYISSANTVGYGDRTHVGTENDEIKTPFTQSYYALSKLAAEDLFLAFANTHPSAHVIVLNPCFMLGAYDTKPNSGKLLKAAYRKRLMFVPPGGKCFIHVNDVAVAVVNALTLGNNGERYLLGNFNLSLASYFRLQSKVLTYKQKAFVIPLWILIFLGKAGDLFKAIGFRCSFTTNNLLQLCVMPNYACDKAKKDLLLPSTSLETAIGDAAHWFYGH